MPRGFFLLIAAQFFSSLADNALLIVTIAHLMALGLPAWWAPLLKLSFALSYVLLAPFVGAWADAMPKRRLMAWMNALKMGGLLALMAGLQPLLAFAIVGLGAAGYAPAKYGLLTELVGPQQLVRANGWLEVSVVCSALLGALCGGLLVSPWWLDERTLLASMMVLLTVYGLASALNFGVPDSGARYPASAFKPLALWRHFRRDERALWRDADGALSLAVTTIFWGFGATLQLAVLRWAADVLLLPLDQAAYLQGAVAVGVVLGAGLAGRCVPLARAKSMLIFGVVLGLLMPVLAVTSALPWAIALLVLTGAVGGLLVVPLNALLQHRGFVLLSAGRSIAVQGFFENASVLVMLAVYAVLLHAGLAIAPLMAALGTSIALGLGVLIWRECRLNAP